MADERVRVVALRTELVDHDHDHWCNTCHLATGIRVVLAVSLQDRMHLQVRYWCMECESRDITPTDEPRHC